MAAKELSRSHPRCDPTLFGLTFAPDTFTFEVRILLEQFFHGQSDRGTRQTLQTHPGIDERACLDHVRTWRSPCFGSRYSARDRRYRANSLVLRTSGPAGKMASFMDDVLGCPNEVALLCRALRYADSIARLHDPHLWTCMPPRSHRANTRALGTLAVNSLISSMPCHKEPVLRPQLYCGKHLT